MDTFRKAKKIREPPYTARLYEGAFLWGFVTLGQGVWQNKIRLTEDKI